MFDDFYGLTGRPFQLTPDPAFYFESLTHRKALSYLSYGLAQGEGFIVITGEVGAGKSTLVAHLMATIDRARLTAAQIVTSRLQAEDMVQAVALAFGLTLDGQGHAADKALVLAAIQGFLHAEARAGRRCLLVVDESQNLSIEALEELRMLSNFQLGAHPLLQILLLGQPEFRENLQGHPRLEQLRQRVIAAHHLEPLADNEVEPYILHRLKLVGWSGNPAFDQRVYTELHKTSGGVPRRLNQLVNRLLILGAVEQRRRIDSAMLSQVLSELDADGGLSLAKAPALPVALAEEPAAVAAAPAKAGAKKSPMPALAPTPDFTAALSQRDAQIAELQQAVVELANGHETERGEGADAAHAALVERLSALEARVIEQDRTIRHTLTMLIEWIERDQPPRAAA